MTKKDVDKQYSHVGPWNGKKLCPLRLEYMEKLFQAELLEDGDNFSCIGVPTSMMIQLIKQARNTNG